MPSYRNDIDSLLGAVGEDDSDEALARLAGEVRDLYFRLYRKFRFGIITALAKEYAALLTAVDQPERLFHPLSQIHYHAGRVPGPDGQPPHFVVLATCAAMGNSASAVAATALLKDFPHVGDLIMAGIAGGIPDLENIEKDVRLGDIIVSSGDGLVQYDMTKIEADRVIVRSNAPKPSARLLAAVNELESLRIATPPGLWEANLARSTTAIDGGARPDPTSDPNTARRKYDVPPASRNVPRVHYGKIGSANSLVKKTELRDELRNLYGVLGVEMEACGLADAAWFDGRGYLIVRGICDYCDMAKNDVWQQYAAGAAMAYVRTLFLVLQPHL